MNYFPTDFTWGAAAASYQIEGAVAEDDKGVSVWDRFCEVPGSIKNNQNGMVACDHYHRWQEDVDLMQYLGLKAYRLSISWPRVLPEGLGGVNQKGIDFYDHLVDRLLGASILPFVTLFHWDYPYSLYLQGGWLNPSSPDWFAEYTKVVVDKIGDRVQHWMTLNEPQVFLDMGHRTGRHAPGDKLPMKEILLATHHALLAHGLSAQVIRARTTKPSYVGYAPVGIILIPASNSPEDVEAARKAMFSIHRGEDVWNNTWFSDPIFLQKYPEDGIEKYRRDLPVIGANDLKIIGQPMDFYAFNFYTGALVRAGKDSSPEHVPYPGGMAATATDWDVTPDGLYWGPKFIWERYQKPIYITENGMANVDWISEDGKVHDPQRIDFTRRYLKALNRAIQDGVDIKGYFHWSIMDNFEWAEGYRRRFGLIYVDYPSQNRILKDSAVWYKDVIATSGEVIFDEKVSQI